MIEDKDVKIAENPIEAKWEMVRKNSENKILEMKLAIEIEEAVKKLAEKKLKQ